ncbi:MAG: dienelactone hydrolase family protein [Sphingorhabdus sp.]|jgi:carboxymethylenebutenolidase|uniref:YghX family hydrolase n=1 Tax=Sphingorhabdus sp. TaxID=1902408 RepID=UPI00273EB4CF|nr:YghX family hydrolase [Sphingorhabdus sp.]MDP4757080.1 dienelactone hydrolase family protein [Sphingorhabdus sp.]MDP4872269.1 dienelactone hydrolase family protein [Sphingorhabdus sp.]MDP4926010.1 dienelactone hydrolase family protein [Sphingorhabdus sp.]
MKPASGSTRMKASDFHPYILEIFDGYVHGKLTKREFIREAGKFAAAGVTGLMILNQLKPDYALAQQVRADDPEIITSRFTVPSPDGHGSINGLLAKPTKAKGKLPAVLVIHENRGLNPYVEDVVRRLAKAGYIALGPDGLSSVGGYPGNDETGRDLQAKLDPRKLLEDFFASFEYLRDHPESTGKVGAVGFCYGGGVCNALAVAYPEMAASVPYYGRQPRAEEVPAIKAPLLVQYAEVDERINMGWLPYQAALIANQKRFSVHFYAGTQHGFHNDSTPRFDKAAADLSWARTLAFLGENLR